MNRAIMTVPGETEAGSAGRQPGRGIAWWAHRDDDRSAEAALLRSSQNHIGSVDPYALKIPARRAESCSLRRELALHFTLNRDMTSVNERVGNQPLMVFGIRHLLPSMLFDR